jgi:formylglycine-generating enzyme required for sulfatase activity
MSGYAIANPTYIWNDFKGNIIMYRYLTLFSLFSILVFLISAATTASPVAVEAAPVHRALVIGIGNYNKLPSLSNPINDAKDMAAILKKLGFEVTLKLNISERVLKNAIQDFGLLLQKDDVALFYYSGYALQFNNRNYLIPKKADLEFEEDIDYDSIKTNFIFEKMTNRQGINIMIFDACRETQSKIKNLKKGLAEIKSEANFLIAYAAPLNQISYDNSKQRNSLYTQYLLAALRDDYKVSMNFLDIVKEVTEQVRKKTGKIPWRTSTLKNRFCLSTCRARWLPLNMSEDLRICEEHFQANRLVTGKGGVALTCYESILRKDPKNIKALAGLKKIEDKYAAWIENALRYREKDKAKRYLANLRIVNSKSKKLAEFEKKLGLGLEKSANEGSDTFVDGQIFRDPLKNGSKGPEMVLIPGGSFRMGDIQGNGYSNENPVQRVSVNRFAMGRYEVTIKEFHKFVIATKYKTDAQKGDGCWVDRNNDGFWEKVKNASWLQAHLFQKLDYPVVCISWNDAVAYANWLSQQTGQQYRLPTEVEWEYAARAKTTASRYWGNNPDNACDYANVHDKTSKEKNRFQWNNHNCTDDYATTAPVGHFKPNAFGLFDMLGNVWEWTCSEYSNRYNGKEKQCAGDNSTEARVIRGGAWNYEPGNVRAAFRNRISPDERGNDTGFRLVRKVFSK